MSNINDLNKVKCEYYVPMGKPGAIVIKAPVILSTLKLSIPINKKIDLNIRCSKFEIISNKISIKKPRLTRDNKIMIDGYIHKSIKYFNDNLGKKLEIKIPINLEVPIDFDHMPIYKPDSFKNSIYEESELINFNFECVELISDYISKLECGYLNKILLGLTITLTQVQNVFIPEPDGDFILISNNAKSPQDNYGSKNDRCHCIVGYDCNMGLIANNIEYNKQT